MNVLSVQPKYNDEQKRLLKLFGQLSSEGQATLMAFAEFLVARTEKYTEEISESIPVPKEIPGSRDESVIKAIKRLSESYFMLDKSVILHEATGLMTQHLMQGRPAQEVIGELEQLFSQHYQKLTASQANTEIQK